MAAATQQLIHAGTSAADARTQAYGLIYQSMQAQAQTLAYIDTYKVLAIGAGIMFLLAFIVRKNDPRGGRRGCRGLVSWLRSRAATVTERLES